jgi:predicted GH43/DUF377 family glycosyl hydrolase
MNILCVLRSAKLNILYRSGRSGILIIIALAIAFCPAVTSAFVKFDFEQRYFSERPIPVLDHCVMEKDGVYHLYYLRGDPALDVGHATTTDFVHWNLEQPLLEPGTWDTRLWAPYVIDTQYGWIMYYTGVNQAGAQQTGMAIGNGPFKWTKVSWPVYHPDPAWSNWDENAWSHGRDPHVIFHNGKYYLFLTAMTGDALGAVACAESADLVNWTDIGPIYVHDSWHVLESVFILERNGLFHMFFTEEGVFGTSQMSSPDLLTGWDISNRRIIDGGHAPQITSLSDGRQMFSRHAIYNDGNGTSFYTLRFDELAWSGDIPAPYQPWGLTGDWNLVWGNAFIYQPVFGNNPKARGEDVADTYEGHCWVGSYERYTGPMGIGTVGGFQGDSRTGVIHSRTFTISGRSMNLLVGGGNDISLLYVALVDAITGEVLCRETGRNTDEMDRRYWNLDPYRGRQVYIEIADKSTGTFGHINCDDIVESPVPLEPTDDTDPNNKVRDRGISTTDDAVTTAPGAGPTLRQNTPNPFNPATTISYELHTAGRVELRVFDVSGKLVRSLVSGDKTPGIHVVDWDGTDNTGRRMSSGVYLYRLVFDGVVVDTRKMMMLK